MTSFSIFATLIVVIFTRAACGQSCQSFGVDIGNGGTYYINPASTAQFSFQSGFIDCTTSDAPVLQLPDGNTITCSTISEATSDTVTSTWCVMNSALMLIKIVQSTTIKWHLEIMQFSSQTLDSSVYLLSFYSEPLSL